MAAPSREWNSARWSCSVGFAASEKLVLLRALVAPAPAAVKKSKLVAAATSQPASHETNLERSYFFFLLSVFYVGVADEEAGFAGSSACLDCCAALRRAVVALLWHGVRMAGQNGLVFLPVASTLRTLQSNCEHSGMLGVFFAWQKKMAATCNRSKPRLPALRRWITGKWIVWRNAPPKQTAGYSLRTKSSNEAAP